MPSISTISKLVHKTAKEKGWWDSPRTVGDCIALMHSELSEALEEYRKHGTVSLTYQDETQDGSLGKPEGFVIELADCVIRIMDFCELHDLDLEDAILRKAEYNMTRSYRHGGKTI